MIKRVKIKIYGNVQGVFFRQSAMEKARELNLTGFVQNEPDGTVYAEAEGEEKLLKDFLSWCKQGPPGVRVMNVESEINDEIKKFSIFEVRY